MLEADFQLRFGAEIEEYSSAILRRIAFHAMSNRDAKHEIASWMLRHGD